jgi:hypothetical protein
MKLQTALGAVFLCSIVAGSGLTQTPSADLQQMRAKLQQLEAMMRNLQEEIAAGEQVQKAPGAPVPPRYLRPLKRPSLCYPSPTSAKKHGKDG